MDPLKQFCVIHFKDDGVEAAPSSWISDDLKTCPWSKKLKTSKKFKKLAMQANSSPPAEWEVFEIHHIVKYYGNCLN
jgi:hypothetical protein